MDNLSIGILSVNVLKAKNLQKIENGTKKTLTVKNPIIKISYISGTKVSTPAEGQGESFKWNCKLNFELIRDKSSFFLQCFNNNTEDNFNLLGETRIPLILAIENEKFKQWYPIYLKEKRNKFVCRGEILLDLHFYSEEKIKRNNLDFSTLIKDELSRKNLINSRKKKYSPDKSPNISSSNSSHNDSSTDKSELQIQPPAIMPRFTRNSGYTSNGISKQNTNDLDNNPLYEDMDEVIYDDNFFEDKYNDNFYQKHRKAVDLHHVLSLNILNEISRSNSTNVVSNFKRKRLNHFNSLPSLRNSENDLFIEININDDFENDNNIDIEDNNDICDNNNNDDNKDNKDDDINSNNNLLSRKLSTQSKNSENVIIPIPKSPISPSTSIKSILKSSPQLKKVDTPSELDTLLNKRLSIINITAPDSPILQLTGISNIKNWKGSLPRSFHKVSINDNNYIHRRTLSDDSIIFHKNNNTKLDGFSYSPNFKNSIMNTLYDKALNNNLYSQSKSCNLELYSENDIPLETRSFQSMSNYSPILRTKTNTTNHSIVTNFSIDIKRNLPHKNDKIIDEEEKKVINQKSQSQSQSQSQKYQKKPEKKEKYEFKKNSNAYKEGQSITLNELTLEEQEFIQKLNKKYNKTFVMINEDDTLSSTVEEEIDCQSSEKSIKNDISKKSLKKTSKNILKNFFSLKSKRKNKKEKSKQKSTKKVYKKPLKKIKSIVSFPSSKMEKSELSENKENRNINTDNNLQMKKSNNNFKNFNKSTENNEVKFNLNNEYNQPTSESSTISKIQSLKQKSNDPNYCSDIIINQNLPSIESKNNNKSIINRSTNEISNFNTPPDQSMRNMEILNHPEEIENKIFSNNNKTPSNIKHITNTHATLNKNYQETSINSIDISKNDSHREDIYNTEKSFENHTNSNINKGKIPELDEYLNSDHNKIQKTIINQNILETKHDNKLRTNDINENVDLNNDSHHIFKYTDNYVDSFGNKNHKNYPPLDRSPSTFNSQINTSSNPVTHSSGEFNKSNNHNILKTNIHGYESPPLSDQEFDDISKETYGEQMLQKLQFQQLAQRITLSYNHYKEYQELIKQVNDKRQPYHELSKMKEQLFKHQQEQLRMQSDLHSQERSDLKQYLDYLQ